MKCQPISRRQFFTTNRSGLFPCGVPTSSVIMYVSTLCRVQLFFWWAGNGEILSHQPYSLELAPLDFYIFAGGNLRQMRDWNMRSVTEWNIKIQILLAKEWTEDLIVWLDKWIYNLKWLHGKIRHRCTFLKRVMILFYYLSFGK